MMRMKWFGWVFLAGLLLLGSAAQAGSIEDFEMIVGPMGSEETLDWATLSGASESIILPEENGGTAVLLNGSYSTDMWSMSWDRLEFNPDPFISFVGEFTNLFAGAQDFILSTFVPIAPLGSTTIGGATTVTVADANFDGIAVLQNMAGMAGYSATIDGSTVLELLDPFSIFAPFEGGVASTSESAGLPGPTLPGPGALATIGITHRFNLSGNDNATFNSTFIVIDAIPEPTTATLLGLGLCVLGMVRRRAR